MTPPYIHTLRVLLQNEHWRNLNDVTIYYFNIVWQPQTMFLCMFWAYLNELFTHLFILCDVFSLRCVHFQTFL